MKIRGFTLLLLGAIAGLTACNRQDTASLPPSPDAPPSATDPGVAPAAQTPAAQSPAVQSEPGSPSSIQPAQGVAPIPVPELIPPTASLQRLPQIDAGRTDPFAALPVTPTVIPKPIPAEPPVIPVAANSPTVIPLPPVTIAAPLPTVQPADPNAVPVPPAPRPVSPTHLAEAIEISGIMQVGGRTNIIVNVPSEGTSRSVQVGDSLANGQVRVKRVEMGLEPIVVLEQNGREITRSVGSGAMVGLI